MTTTHPTKAYPAASSSYPSEHRHCKTYSTSKCGASSSGLSVPRRKSCDVRARNTLLHLFSLNDEENGLNGAAKVESKNLGALGVTDSVFESRGEDENGDKVRVSGDALGQNVNANEHRFDEFEEELKPMKELIELEWQSRKHAGRDLKDIAGSLWVAASVFSQKLKKWRLKQSTKKHRGGSGTSTAAGGGHLLQPEKLNRRRLGETQSEVGVYGHGRRSCDTDPRFSVDAGRMSLDDPIRFSFDEPRASWDGYMTVKPIPQLPAMLSVIENVTVLPINRPENGMSVEEQMNSIIGENESSTCDCSDSSSSQRQNSCDCSNPTINDALHRMNSVVRDRDTRSSDFNSHKYDDNTKEFKKSGGWQKVWKILGFMHRLTDTEQEDVEGGDIGLIGHCSEKQSGVVNGVSSGKLVRSGSCVGSYNPSLSRVAEIRGYAK